LERGNNRWGKDDTSAKGIPALMVDQPGAQQQIRGVAEIGQMTPQIAARSITEAKFLHQVRILQTSILQIHDRLRTAVELRLEKGGSPHEQLGLRGQSDVLVQTGETFAKREVLGKLHKADQVTAAMTAMAVEQILAGVDIEGRPGIPVQRAESHELVARGEAPTGPMAPLQILQQRNTLFELFQILAHGAVFFLRRV
jgi:hypothetical protein